MSALDYLPLKLTNRYRYLASKISPLPSN